MNVRFKVMTMNQDIGEILVFKTNLRSQDHVAIVAPRLNTHPGIRKWNVDCHDVDCVLRIVSDAELSPEEIIRLVRESGFSCEELSD